MEGKSNTWHEMLVMVTVIYIVPVEVRETLPIRNILLRTYKMPGWADLKSYKNIPILKKVFEIPKAIRSAVVEL
jgi:hypothetical protein